jgi:hydroxyacylglutathione hydrolase
MNLSALPAFTDNYIWMLHDGRRAWVVDPGDAKPVRDALQAHRLALAGILVTHHHIDHVGGLADLLSVLDGPVMGPAHEAMPVPVTPVGAGDTVEVLGWTFRVLDVPGHTAGHVAYVAEPEAESPLLFCGDTLFSGGCGRLFEGTPAQMHHSLQQLAALPGDTRVCCTHEYTLSNLRFAAAVEPRNAALQRYTAWCEAERAALRPTLPSSIGREREINPFMRCDVPDVAAAARQHGACSADTVEVLAALRLRKNVF